jgi:pantoate kinase
MRAKAFSPGHVTGFFEICRTGDILRTGSRGAGLCLSLGATTEVRYEVAAEQGMDVIINGEPDSAPVTRHAIADLIGERLGGVTVRTDLDLPVSQGFGMSAAGALSASVALAELLGLGRQRAFEAAHSAEVECGCGLGDVSAIHRSGITIRAKAGLPPTGEVVGIDGAPEVVLAVAGQGLPTKDFLSDPLRTSAVNRIGGALVDQLLEAPTLDNLMDLSRHFAEASGLASPELLRMIDSVKPHGMASMAMLGNSVFAVGDPDALRQALSGMNAVFYCTVDTEGARLLHS